jgi:hypothetical protein
MTDLSNPAQTHLAEPASPGALSAPTPTEGDLWALSREAFATLTRRALSGELVSMKGDL